MYQEHLLSFTTSVLQIIFADVDDSGKIYLIGMLCLSPGLYYCMRDGQPTKVIEDGLGIYFLQDPFFDFGMEVCQTDRVFQFTETGFLAPPELVDHLEQIWLAGNPLLQGLWHTDKAGRYLETDDPEKSFVVTCGFIQKVKICFGGSIEYVSGLPVVSFVCLRVRVVLVYHL